MKTEVIKYDHPKSPKQKDNSFFLFKLIKSIIYILFRILTFWIPRASPDYKRQMEYIDYWYIEIDSITGIPQREIGFDISNHAILYSPNNRNLGCWTDSDLTFELNKYPLIELAIFDDIFDAMIERNMDCITHMINKYQQKWIDNKTIETPVFPLLIYDLSNYNETFYCKNFQILSDVDLIGYEWDLDKRVIDAKGNVYKTIYINFGHPIGCVYPEKIEENMTLEKFRNLLKQKFNKSCNKEFKGQTFEELFAELDIL